MGANTGLYDESFEHDGCGIGMVARRDGKATRVVVDQGLEILANLAHRGAIGSDAKTSDGSGVMSEIPREFLAGQTGLALGDSGFALGMIFQSGDSAGGDGDVEKIAGDFSFEVAAWREVPVRHEILGAQALATLPRIRQIILRDRISPDKPRETDLFLMGQAVEEARGDIRFVSLSFTTVVYKALVFPESLAEFFPDLRQPDFKSAFILAHSRFSTNTQPSWPLAHPFRYICHNGEINTIRGNRAWMKSRAGQSLKGVIPSPADLSDSASLDQAVELLVRNGKSLPEALMILIPQAWENHPDLPDGIRAFYEFHAARMEPWDGPAAVCFADGRFVGATLDRSGFRPCRYVVLRDGTLVLASEAGALRVDRGEIIERGRLGPAQMILLDLQEKVLLKDLEIKSRVAGRRDYRALVTAESPGLTPVPPAEEALAPLSERLHMFSCSEEELRMVLRPMFATGEEPPSSMGNDTPLAVLSDQPQPLSKYFRQAFAQVTNPPIDPLREGMVMSLATYLGPRGDLLGREAAPRLRFDQPVLSPSEFASLSAGVEGLAVRRLDLTFAASEGVAGFVHCLNEIRAEALKAARDGICVLLLSDARVDLTRAGVPALLAVGAVHRALLESGLRMRASLVVDTGEARDVHQLACLIGYGADAVYPRLVFDLAAAECLSGAAAERFVAAAGKGLLTIMSKMGISSLRSYCGAEVFEIIGLARELVNEFFPATPSRLGGLSLTDVARETLWRHSQAGALFRARPGALVPLSPGEIHYRAGGEVHAWNPVTIASLQKAARANDRPSYNEYKAECERVGRFALRGLLRWRTDGGPIALTEVESAAFLVKRFTTGAMSFGSLSQEAHETLAVAMNRIGGKSNSGEGGENPERFLPDDNGDCRNSAIKQVASGRFGVTAHYLVNARELQIKMAQGAKPGEGGKLPGFKIDAIVAKLRHSTPGVTLISPPPHHDIYSIEDLAQLIHDLKQVNPAASVSVKLVATAGVGTIASGVVKAGADKILVSGDSGGTGASPLSSIKSAGSPWELGLAEVQQTLVRQGLRGRVRVEVDGQMKTGRDVAIAALLGAEEFGFSTAPLVVEGCVMMRKCHLNTCPVGVATQDSELRKKFTGAPEHVINFFFFVAEELRAIMAELGVRRLEDMVGRADWLESFLPAKSLAWKVARLDLSPLLAMPKCRIPGVPTHLHRDLAAAAHPRPQSALARQVWEFCQPAWRDGQPVRGRFEIFNTDRAVGARISGEVALHHGARGLPPQTIVLDFHGTAGQSFGAFLTAGTDLRLDGDANDYVGKGLSGGRIVVAPEWSQRVAARTAGNVVAGNACLYGGTAGEAYFAGVAGERFAVRNSGVLAVVEGVGDHGCEYMTGGVVVILGRTGRNFAAGMSGGIAYVYDPGHELPGRMNGAGFELLPANSGDKTLLALVMTHYDLSGSAVAKRLLEDWANEALHFVRVIPLEYKNALAKREPARAAPPREGAVAHV